MIDFIGAPGRNRTADLRFTKPLLYQLSYKGMRHRLAIFAAPVKTNVGFEALMNAAGQQARHPENGQFASYIYGRCNRLGEAAA